LVSPQILCSNKTFEPHKFNLQKNRPF